MSCAGINGLASVSLWGIEDGGVISVTGAHCFLWLLGPASVAIVAIAAAL